jgi:hypothetical protein
VILIKPSHYDNDGFVYRFARGVLPSNSLAVMRTLTQQALADAAPPTLTTKVYTFDDGTWHDARQLAQLYNRHRANTERLIVGLVGVQTAQFPRACEIIKQWQNQGAICVIGGSHVTGLITTAYDGIAESDRRGIPCPHRMPEELSNLMQLGVIIFHGEAERHTDNTSAWTTALADIIAGQPKPLYRGGQPDLSLAPLPEQSADMLRNYVTAVRTIDTSRGCRFKCSFCAVINAQGRTMRCRNPADIIAYVRSICRREGKGSFFFTDDNFARNPCWPRIVSGLAELRQQGLRFNFMIQADLACGKLPGFIEKLAAAGCGQIFFGVESLNPKNLLAAGKTHNRPEHYRTLWEQCHKHGITVHTAYIIGFPYDTPESVRSDIDQLLSLGADQASFFMLGPVPGSEDHIRLYHAGQLPNPDWNQYDTFHAVVPHPCMTPQQWQDTFRQAWRQFYQLDHMIIALRRLPQKCDRRRLLCNYLWYWWATKVERTHPMIAGLYRTRSLTSRRPCAEPLSYPRYLRQEIWRHVRYVCYFLAAFYVFQHVVFETEYRPGFSEQKDALSENVRGLRDWLGRTFGPAASRQWLNNFWRRYGGRHWRLLNPLEWDWHIRMVPHAITELVYTIRFMRRFTAVLWELRTGH